MYKASATDVFLKMYEFFKTAEAATGGVPWKKCSWKSHNIHKKTPVLEPLWCLWSQLYCKVTPTQISSSEYYEMFKNTYFKEHLGTTAP